MVIVMMAVIMSLLPLQERIQGFLSVVQKVLLLVDGMNCGCMRRSVVGPKVVV
jgi:hypothetical protein